MNSKKKRLDTIRGKKVKDFKFTEDIISEDPFDIFYANSPSTHVEDLQIEEVNSPSTHVEDLQIEGFNSSIVEFDDATTENINKENISNIKTTVKKKDKERSNKNSSVADVDFFAALIKSKEVKKVKVDLTPRIINQLEIYTSKDLHLTSIPMYKFPHIPDIKFEEGALFKSLYCLFIRSLLNAFKSKKAFILKYKAELIIFENSIMRATKGLERILKSNDIEFEIEDLLIIKGVNINLVIDFLLNEPLTNSYSIPLILSKDRFVNGIFYEINLKKDKSAIKDNEQILYKYTLEGPFLNEDFLEYFDFKHKVT